MRRRATALRLLHAGIDTSLIALWLGHGSVDTTQVDLHVDLNLQECSALQRATVPAPAADRRP